MVVSVAATPAADISGVLERMAALDRTLAPTDGVAHFNRLYFRVTEAVLGAMRDATFKDAQWLEHLDVVFANLFFDAVRADAGGNPIPPAWAPLFEHRARAGSHPIQFALAGMNAHINHDLPLAVVATCREKGCSPDDDSPQHQDFTTANEILRATQAEVKAWFLTGVLAELDDAGGRIDDALSMWCIAGARAVAWVNAQALWALDDDPALRRAYLAAMERVVAIGGRGVLV